MANNRALNAQNTLKITDLSDFLMSEGEVARSAIPREQLFEIKDAHEASLGFAKASDLKEYIYKNEEATNGLMVRNVDQASWITVFEHPLFQRRKPQLVSASSLESDDDQQFFVLIQGQKTGPYEKFEMLSMLEQKEILLTDMVSTNAGHTWMKLYQIDNFDRRVLKESDKLPGMPGEMFLKGNESVRMNSPETEAISSLAYLSNVKRGKSIEREKNQSFESDKNVSQKSSSIYKWLLVGSILGIGYFLFHIKNQLNSPFTDSVSPIGEQAPMLTPVEMGGSAHTITPGGNGDANSRLGERQRVNQVNDQGRSDGKFETRTFRPIPPVTRKSFMETGKYQEINGQNNTSADDPNYFYDNTSAMELDPVRSQVSRENYDNSQAESQGPIPSSDALFENEASN